MATDSSSPELQEPPSKRIILKSISDTVVLKQLIETDAPVFYDLVDRNRDHFNQLGLGYAEMYPTLDSVKYALANPDNPKKYAFGIWEGETLVGENSVLDCEDGTGLIESMVGKEFAGNGFAARARALLVDFAFNQLGLDKLIGHVVANNKASRKSVEKSGFTLEKEMAGVCTYVLKNPSPLIC